MKQRYYKMLNMLTSAVKCRYNTKYMTQKMIL